MCTNIICFPHENEMVDVLFYLHSITHAESLNNMGQDVRTESARLQDCYGGILMPSVFA